MPEKDLANDFSLRKTALNNLYASSNTCMVTWSMVKEERLLIESLQNGIADFKDLTEDLKQYKRYANSLHTVFGVVMMGEKIIILFSLRKHILAALHAAHRDVGAMNQRTRDYVFWSRIPVNIIRTRD